MHKDRNNGEEVGRATGLKKKSEEQKSNKDMSRNKFYQALNLPTLCNMNPQSVYNKIEEFHTFVKEEQVDLLFMSESWERESLTLDQIIKLDDHIVISNVYQRKGVGGRPAIIANKSKYEIQNVTNTLVQIPWGVGGCLVCVDSQKCHTQQQDPEDRMLLTVFQA